MHRGPFPHAGTCATHEHIHPAHLCNIIWLQQPLQHAVALALKCQLLRQGDLAGVAELARARRLSFAAAWHLRRWRCRGTAAPLLLPLLLWLLLALLPLVTRLLL